MVSDPLTVSALTQRWASLVGGQRVIVGLAGAPGAGKSTVVYAIIDALRERGIAAASVPMDGYHLSDVTLDRLGRRARKGALDTFDGHGYLSLLRRLRSETGNTVYAPGFDREIEQPIAGAIAIEPEVQIIVTEGNYLLFDDAPWGEVRTLLDEVWFIRLDGDERRRRLYARHERFGKSPEAARKWVTEVDEPNAILIEATVSRATGIVQR